MKHTLNFCAVMGALALFASASHAQSTASGTQFVPGVTGGTGATTVGGGFIHPAGLAQDGNPNQFNVGGFIAEYIELTAIDDQLELGNLGGPQNIGWVASLDPTSNPGVLSGINAAGQGSPNYVTQTTGNGIAGVEIDSNSYITVEANYGANISNPGPTASPADDYSIPTQYRVAARGREFRFGTLPVQTSSAYTSYQSAVGSGNSSKVTFSPGAQSGLRIMAEAQRNGLNNYRGQYQTTIAVNYIKF